MVTIRHPLLLILGALTGCAFAGFLVIKQQYHPDTANDGLLAYGWFSPRVERALTTDQLVPSVTAGTEAASYTGGELSASLSSGLDPVVGAFDSVIPQFQIFKVSETRTTASVVIVARTLQDTSVTFKMTAAANNVTRVTILVGDEPLARSIFEKVKANL